MWHRITSIDLSHDCHLSLNLIKQIKLKMPNLVSIHLPSNFSWYSKFINEHDTTLNSVTTISCGIQFLPVLRPWLLEIVPNVKHFLVSFNQVSINCSMLAAQFLAFVLPKPNESKWTATDYTHFSNIEDVEIQFDLFSEDELTKNMLDVVKGVLGKFQNNKIMTLLSMETNSANYQINQNYNYLQLVKKNYIMNN
jgi:hypothetical protein